MRIGPSLVAIPVIALLCLSSSAAEASLPSDQQVVYHIRAVPSDPQSTVVFDLSLALSAQSVDGDQVGWRVDRVECSRAIDGVVTVWTEDAPAVSSPDGLWWVQHADVNAPQVGEFASPPLLEGTAVTDDPQQPALEYSLAGAQLTEPSSVPYAHATALTFALTLANESEPIKTGSDEPTEVGGDQVLKPT